MVVCFVIGSLFSDSCFNGPKDFDSTVNTLFVDKYLFNFIIGGHLPYPFSFMFITLPSASDFSYKRMSEKTNNQDTRESDEVTTALLFQVRFTLYQFLFHQMKLAHT